jgi:hypothetical protein
MAGGQLDIQAMMDWFENNFGGAGIMRFPRLPTFAQVSCHCAIVIWNPELIGARWPRLRFEPCCYEHVSLNLPVLISFIAKVRLCDPARIVFDSDPRPASSLHIDDQKISAGASSDI